MADLAALRKETCVVPASTDSFQAIKTEFVKLPASRHGSAWFVLALLLGTAVAFVFALAGVAKIADPTQTWDFVQAGLGIPHSVARVMVTVIAYGELLVAAWLAFNCSSSRRPGTAALIMVGFFAGLLFAAAQKHPWSKLTCGCFGALQPPLGGRSIMSHFYFDCLLAGILALHLYAISRTTRRDTSTVQAISDGPFE